MNKYIPTAGKTKYKQYEHDLMSYIDDLKYNQSTKNTDEHFQKAKLLILILYTTSAKTMNLNIRKSFIKQLEIKTFRNMTMMLRKRF